MEKAYKLEFGSEKSGSLYVNCCGCSKTEPLHSFGPAVKPHFLIHYVLSGKGIFKTDNRTYHLQEGYGFLISPDELVFYQSDKEEPWTYVWIGFAGNQAQQYLEGMGLSAGHPIFESEESEELYEIVRDMMEHNTFGMANELRRNGLLGMFLSTIAASGNVVEANEEDRGNQYITKAVSFIQNNYCNPIKVTDVANFVCINRSYLYTLFLTYLEMSPQQFLTNYRIAKAAELLQSTEYSVESIALSCGYGDALVFSKAFRQMRGLSPSGYRKEVKAHGNRKEREEFLENLERYLSGAGRVEGGEP